MSDIQVTPLNALHRELGGKMVPFAGYDMPVQYPGGIMVEHKHTREAAGLFDVSHMGQALLHGDDPAAAFEMLVPGDIQGLAPGTQRYTMLTNDAGGILDDLMVANRGDHLALVVNAACKEADFAHIEAALAGRATLEILQDRALLALQGPKAAQVLSRLADGVGAMAFMDVIDVNVDGHACTISRSGYTGEDGYEISVAASGADALARRLLAETEVAAIGLGARDSLRLEAGLCLYGADIDETTTPIEAGLTWAVGKSRRTGSGYPGADVIAGHIQNGVTRKRVGIRPEGRAPARAHTAILDMDGNTIGEITSGGFGPSVNGPVAMGYVPMQFAKADTLVMLEVRGKALPARVTKMPFSPHNYYRG